MSELVSNPNLPDPLTMADGRRVTTPEDWKVFMDFADRRL